MKRTHVIRGAGLGGLLATLLAGALGGCAGYRVGSTLPPNIHTVYVGTFVNKTDQPDLEFQTTRATLQEIQKDGTLKISTQDKADVILEAKITKYTLEPLRYRKDQATTPNEYRIHLLADVILRRANTMKVLVSVPNVEGWATFTVTTDLRSNELTAIPNAATDLGHEIVKNVVEFW